MEQGGRNKDPPPSLLLALSKRLKMFGGFKQNKKKTRMERFIKQRLEKQISYKNLFYNDVSFGSSKNKPDSGE